MPSRKNQQQDQQGATTTAPAVDALPPLESADSAVPGVKKHRRASSSAQADVYKPEELKELLGEDKDLVISKEIQKINWKMNTSPASLEEAASLKTTPISDPKVRKLTIFFSTGLHVTARASSTITGKTLGVTVFDVLNAIHKQMKKKAEDELELPVLANIEWGRGDDLKTAEGGEWPAVCLVQQKKEQAPQGKKKKNN